MQRVLLVVNTYAGLVSARKLEVITKALMADFDLEVARTASRNHASDLARGGVEQRFDAVLAFGGDGTINEIAQGLVATDVALGILPGGTTNVMARSLGVPTDVIEAVAFNAEKLRLGARRRVHVGRVNGRYFLFSAGIGLDAEVVRRIEEDPDAKRRWGEWAFAAKALRAGLTEYRTRDPFMTLQVAGERPERVIFAIACNGQPFTYFKRWAVAACPYADLDARLDVLSFVRLRARTVPRLVWSLFRSRSHPAWRTVRYYRDVGSLTVTAAEPAPLQVDGDFIGYHTVARISHAAESLDLLV